MDTLQTWEVNIRLKLQEIERACKRVCGTQRLEPLSGQEPRLAALSDLQSANSGIPSPSGFTIRWQYFMPSIFHSHTDVQQALKDIMHKLAYQPASRPQTLPNMVVDVVASLFQAIVDEGEARDRA
ncbi:hypothetical protein COCON_G00090240 [Conger conger]|uniref:Uncharacterized protein n=1 Tax=Conger conger TaxID=82655 RepID=A0A9Q1HZ03_CONCO|nr:hypothetical protein COCON_G00090240 [Conger conger]